MNLKELKSIAAHWKAEIDSYDRESEKWYQRARKVIQRYMDDRTDMDANRGSRYNILWANVETILPAVYARPPKPDVSRRHKDRSPVGRVASMILERCLDYETTYYSDYDAGIRNAVKDRFLPGRGVVWIRYEPTFGERAVQITEDVAAMDEESDGEMELTEEYVEHECSPVDYVHWEHFGHTCARTWEEVSGVWRDVALTRKELKDRFGEGGQGYKVSEIPLDVRDDGEVVSKERPGHKAKIYEVYDKVNKRVIWLHKSIDVPLDVKDDPLGLENFFPCPKPLYATLCSDTLMPVPDYCMYQDQALELDEVTARISLLTEALQVAGVYDAEQESIKRLLTSGRSNKLIPVDNWAAFGEKGGLKGTIDFMPLSDVVNALVALYDAREQIKQVIYEITGLSDIIRGSSDARETATAQRIKSQFGSLRIRTTQESIAHFAKQLLCLKAEIIANHYSDETIYNMAGVSQMTEQDQQIFPFALQLIRDDLQRGFLIEIQTDSMVQMDEQADQQARVEFLASASGFLEKAVPAAEAYPQIAPLLGEMLLFGVRGFKVGRSIEGVFDEVVENLKKAPAKPDPEGGKAQAEQQKMQFQMQMEQMKAQLDMQKQQMELEKQQQQMQIDMMMKQLDARLMAEEVAVEADKLQNKNRYEQAQHARKMESLEAKDREGMQ